MPKAIATWAWAYFPRVGFPDDRSGCGRADPEGKHLALQAAEPVYQLYNATGRMGYHIRPGKHDILWYDWLRYVNFLDPFLKLPQSRR